MVRAVSPSFQRRKAASCPARYFDPRGPPHQPAVQDGIAGRVRIPRALAPLATKLADRQPDSLGVELYGLPPTMAAQSAMALSHCHSMA
jgi:hypothetical protein